MATQSIKLCAMCSALFVILAKNIPNFSFVALVLVVQQAGFGRVVGKPCRTTAMLEV